MAENQSNSGLNQGLFNFLSTYIFLVITGCVVRDNSKFVVPTLLVPVQLKFWPERKKLNRTEKKQQDSIHKVNGRRMGGSDPTNFFLLEQGSVNYPVFTECKFRIKFLKNSNSLHIRSMNNIDAFKSALKTHYYRQAFE